MGIAESDENENDKPVCAKWGKHELFHTVMKLFILPNLIVDIQ